MEDSKIKPGAKTGPEVISELLHCSLLSWVRCHRVTEPGKAQLVRWQMVPKILPRRKQKPKERGNHIFWAAGFMPREKEMLGCHHFLQHCWRGIGRERKAGAASQAHLDLLGDCMAMECHFLPPRRCSCLCLLPEHSTPPQRGCLWRPCHWAAARLKATILIFPHLFSLPPFHVGTSS